MKKAKPALWTLISVIMIIVLYVPFSLFLGHMQILSGKNETLQKYASYSAHKEPYTLVTYIVNEEDMEFIRFRVMDDTENTVIFEPQSEWRALDFKGISFADGSYDIVLLSGDVGEMIYQFQENGTWQLTE